MRNCGPDFWLLVYGYLVLVVEIENNSSWRWFLELLKADLEMWNNSEWCLMSDQQKGLTNVIAELFPGVEHRNCARITTSALRNRQPESNRLKVLHEQKLRLRVLVGLFFGSGCHMTKPYQ